MHLHLSDAFIQSDLHSRYSFYILSALAFPGNRTHDLDVASAMLYQLSYRKANNPWIIWIIELQEIIATGKLIIMDNNP